MSYTDVPSCEGIHGSCTANEYPHSTAHSEVELVLGATAAATLVPPYGTANSCSSSCVKVQSLHLPDNLIALQTLDLHGCVVSCAML
jgi:hypothetical protein